MNVNSAKAALAKAIAHQRKITEHLAARNAPIERAEQLHAQAVAKIAEIKTALAAAQDEQDRRIEAALTAGRPIEALGEAGDQVAQLGTATHEADAAARVLAAWRTQRDALANDLTMADAAVIKAQRAVTAALASELATQLLRKRVELRDAEEDLLALITVAPEIADVQAVQDSLLWLSDPDQFYPGPLGLNKLNENGMHHKRIHAFAEAWPARIEAVQATDEATDVAA
jgi:hypothetical protein